MTSVFNSTYGITIFENGDIIGRSNKYIYGEIDKYGYRRVGVAYYDHNTNRIRKHKFVHRLVAEHFLPDYSDSLVVNHKDCNKLNNHYSNLEMVTIKYNTNHAIDNNLCPHMVSSEIHRLVKYSDELVNSIYYELQFVERYSNGNIKAGELIRIANKLGISRHVVKNYSRKREIRKYLK